MIIRNTAGRHARRALATSVTTKLTTTRPVTMHSKIATSEPLPAATTGAEPTSEAHAALSQALAYKRKLDEAEALKAELAKVPDNFRKFVALQKKTLPLGSEVVARYEPGRYLKDPPSDATLEMLMAAQTHMGHNTSLWNPANARYIYGVRAGIHIIDLETTAAHLRRAARVVEEVAYHGGLILFVGTRKGQKQVVVRAAELAEGCHLFQKWTPGAITNRDQILGGGQLKMVDILDREVEGLEEHLQEQRPVVPDLVVCLNPLENYTLLYECGLAGIPTIGVVDTDADPSWVTYQIPANDDSLRSIELLACVLGKAGGRGQQRRREAAANGRATWEQPMEVRLFKENKITEETTAKLKAEEEKLAQLREAEAESGGQMKSRVEGLQGELMDQIIQEKFKQ